MFNQVRDVATSEAFREERTMKRRRPRAIWIQGLRPARRYAIEFEGVSNKKDRTGELRDDDAGNALLYGKQGACNIKSGLRLA